MRDIWNKIRARAERQPGRFFALAFGSAVLIGFLTAALLVNVFERKQEAYRSFFRVVELNEDTEDPAVWGKNFPLQYEDYLRTVDQQRTRYGGSEAVPRTPTQADPRSLVAQSKLEEDPRLKTMWAGYAFSVDFREERGHAYMLEDQVHTERQKVGQPGTCLNCHASTYPVYRKLGDGDITKGFEAMNQMSYPEARSHAKHAVACIDCHEPGNMQLRVTRPAFLEGMRAYKQAVHGVADYDVNRDATRQEMRSYVCGQCHVEYYFKGKEKRLTYPWTEGLRADNILAYYEKTGFKDWTHKQTGAPVLKAQHPEFEMWSQGVHARSGVTCSDCHMPYKRAGGAKISDHHVRSPLLNVQNACQTCHPIPEAELKARATALQSSFLSLRDVAFDALVDYIGDLEKARKNDPERDVSAALAEQRRAQFYLDFVEAENSMGFHAPQEAMRVLGLSIEHVRRGQKELWKRN